MNKKTLPILLAVPLLLACETEVEKQVDVAEPVALNLSSSISVSSVTRAYDSSWEKNDKIGVFTTATGTMTVTTSGSAADENILYNVGVSSDTETYDSSEDTYTYSSFSPNGTPIYLPADGSKVDVYAYYPYLADVTAAGGRTISVETTQTVANQKTFDLMTAKVQSTVLAPIWRNNPNVKLLFCHVMSKVLIKVKRGTGYSDDDIKGQITQVVLEGQPTSGTFLPVAQTMSINATTATLTPCEVTSSDVDYDSSSDVLAQYRTIVFPNNKTDVVTGNEASSTGRTIVFTIGDVTYTYTITHAFQPGEQTTFTITLSGKEVTVSAAITPWNPNFESKTLYPVATS